MSRARRFLVLFAVSLSLLSHAIPVFAAPTGWKSVNVTLHSEQQQSVLLVSGQLPPETKLPAEAELAVPAGTELQWIGEILGGDPSLDPTLEYTKSTSGGMDVYRFTLVKARVAQVEGSVPDVTLFDGANYVTGLRWTALKDLPELTISQRVPQSAQIVQVAPGASLQPADTGYSYYTKTVRSPKAGDVIDLSFSYALPAGGATNSAQAGGASTSSSIALVIILVVFGGALALLVRGVSRKMAAKTANAAVEAEADSSPAIDSGASAPLTITEPEVEPLAEAPGKRRNATVPIMIVVAGVFLLGFMIAGSKGTSAAVVNGRISRDFGSASECQTTSLPFTAKPGVDVAKVGNDILKGFEGMEGVGEVTIDLAASKIDMGWCESSQSEESMRQVLSGTGLITLGEATSTADSVPGTSTPDAVGK